MSAALVTYSGDRRLVLSGNEAIRAPIYGALPWAGQIRIGLRGSFVNASGDITGTPVLAFGLCRGKLGNGATTPTHVVGVRTQATSFTRSAGPPAYHTIMTSTSMQAFKRVGATLTSTGLSITGGTGNILFSADTAVRNALFANMTISSSSSMAFKIAGPGTSGSAQHDLTDAEFQAMMEQADLSTVSSVVTGYAATSAGIAFAVNQGTDGVLDNIFVYWDRTSQQFSFDIMHRNLP